MTVSSRLKDHANRGYLIAVLSAFLLSLTGILIRFLTTHYQLPALILAFWRALMVFGTLAVIMGLRSPKLLKLPLKQLPFIAIYGFVLAVFNSTWTLSVATNGAAAATVMVYCSAAFTAVLAWIFLKESLGTGKLTAVVLSLAGCLLVSGAYLASSWNANFLGIATGILAGLCYAVYSLLGRSASMRGINSWTTLVYIFAFDAIFLLAFNLIPAHFPGAATKPADLLWPTMDWIGWIVLFLLASLPTLLGFGTYLLSLNYLPASIVNLVATLEPFFTTIIAYILFRERLNLIQLAGGILIVSGVVVTRLTEMRKLT